jgi:hypothetical protein
MKLKEKKPISSIILYVAASVTGILGIALLINNVILYYKNVTQYVAQGYAVETVTGQLIPSQLLPGVFEPLALYGGIALLLVAAAIINQKVSKCLAALTEKEICENAVYVKAEEPAEEPVKAPVVESDEEVETIEDKEIIEESSSSVEGDK